MLDAVVAATRRCKGPLKGADKIALRVGKVVGKYKMAKHFELDIGERAFGYSRKADGIAAEAALDGIYIVRTSLPADELGAAAAVAAYKGLSVVERAFRSYKTVDLKVRPIYHYADRRVRAHVFLCMLAYYVEWHMRQRLKPLLFDDHEADAARAARTSVVAPAEVSDAARDKARSKRHRGGPAGAQLPDPPRRPGDDRQEPRPRAPAQRRAVRCRHPSDGAAARSVQTARRAPGPYPVAPPRILKYLRGINGLARAASGSSA